jgi:hypothetical protein
MTEEISGEKYVTESLIIPVIRGIHLKLNDIETKRLMNTDIGKLMFQTLKTSVIQRLNRGGFRGGRSGQLPGAPRLQGPRARESKRSDFL